MSEGKKLFEQVRSALAGVAKTCETCPMIGRGCVGCPVLPAKEALEKMNPRLWKAGVRVVRKQNPRRRGARGRPESEDMFQARKRLLGHARRMISRDEVIQKLDDMKSPLKVYDVIRAMVKKGCMEKRGKSMYEIVSRDIDGVIKSKVKKQRSSL